MHHSRTRGNYSAFECVTAEKARAAESAALSREGRRKHIQSFVDKFRANAKKASLVQSRLKTLARLEAVEAVTEAEQAGIEKDPNWKFSFPAPAPLGAGAGGSIIRINDLGFGYDPSNMLFRNITLNVEVDSRVAILGANGSGKSTLLRLLLGDLEPVEGFIWRHPKLTVAVFDQHHADRLLFDKNAVENVQAKFPETPLVEIRRHLGQFGIGGELALRPVNTLSGGQKSRVSFALLSFHKPGLIVLDEPTNHLDMQTIDSLVLALSQYEGALLCVSHDRFFVEQLCQNEGVLFALRHNTLTRFPGDIHAYAKMAAKEATVPQGISSSKSKGGRDSSSDPRRAGAASGGGARGTSGFSAPKMDAHSDEEDDSFF